MEVYSVTMPLVGAQDTDELGIYDSLGLAIQEIDKVNKDVGIWYSECPQKGEPYRFPTNEPIFPVHNYDVATITRREVITGARFRKNGYPQIERFNEFLERNDVLNEFYEIAGEIYGMSPTEVASNMLELATNNGVCFIDIYEFILCHMDDYDNELYFKYNRLDGEWDEFNMKSIDED